MLSPLPFKIGGLVLPMLNHNATYDEALRGLVFTIESHYAGTSGFFPIVSCGETCDALGYGSDILDVLTEKCDRQGYYFTHKSGENNKCSQNYADSDLCARIAYARRKDLTPLIIAVGGGGKRELDWFGCSYDWGADFIGDPHNTNALQRCNYKCKEGILVG